MSVSKKVPDDAIRDFIIAMMTYPDSYGTSDHDLFVTWGLSPFGQHRDSGLLDQSNFACVLRDLQAEFPDDVSVQHAGHWAVGWCDTITIRVIRERPAQPPRLYGAALEKWEASWEYREATVKELKGAALARWIETRVTPAAIRAAEIYSALQGYPLWDEADHSEREHEKMTEDWAGAWSEMHRCWDDEPEWDGEPNPDYDGPRPPAQAPGYDDEDFGFAYDVFDEKWSDSGGDMWMSGGELKKIILEGPEYSAWCVKQEQVHGQETLF